MAVEIVLTDGVYPLTAEAIPELTKKITHGLAVLGFPRTAGQSLEDFLMALHGDRSVTGVALVSPTGRIPGPDLDFYVLPSREYRENLQLYQEDMRRIGGYHDSFVRVLREAHDPENYYGTLIHIISSSSVEAFKDHLVRRFGQGFSAGVLVVATLMRP